MTECFYGDPLCPCQDGDLCNHEPVNGRDVGSVVQPYHVRPVIEALQRQVDVARYAFHKVCVKKYHDAVQSNYIPIEQAREQYRLAMVNYDVLIAHAPSGTSSDANQADMDKGFPL